MRFKGVVVFIFLVVVFGVLVYLFLSVKKEMFVIFYVIF